MSENNHNVKRVITIVVALLNSVIKTLQRTLDDLTELLKKDL